MAVDLGGFLDTVRGRLLAEIANASERLEAVENFLRYAVRRCAFSMLAG